MVKNKIIYLIESWNYYKIGITENLELRLKQYETINPEWEVIDNFNGILRCEKELHELCKDFHHKGEWFHKDPKILEIFSNYKHADLANACHVEIKKILEKCNKKLIFINSKLSKTISAPTEYWEYVGNLINDLLKEEKDISSYCELCEKNFKEVVEFQRKLSSTIEEYIELANKHINEYKTTTYE